MRWPLTIVLLVGLGAGCVLQLDHTLACGDGFVDELAGEECDPGDENSFARGCEPTDRPDGAAACDPGTCELIATLEQCAVCGDGFIDPEVGEECDGEDLGGALCPGGAEGTLRCGEDCKFDVTLCDECPNGMVDEGEECDTISPGGFVSPRPCAGSDLGKPSEVPPLPSPFGDAKRYSSGEVRLCTETCRYERQTCGYCDDGDLDGAIRVGIDDNATTLPEWCDGDIFDEGVLIDRYGMNWCTEEGDRPNVGCADDCLGFIERFDEGRCCRRRAETCPVPGEEIECCHGFDHPGELPCEQFMDVGSPLIRSVCK
jgi:hypothetical protein